MSETTLATVGASGVYHPDHWGKALVMAKALSDSTMVPREYRGNQANCLIALEIATRLGMTVLQVMQSLYLVHGRPSWSAQFIISLVNASGRFTPLEFRMTGEGDTRTCVAHAVRIRGRAVVDGPPVSIKMAKAEGWYSRKSKKTGDSASKWPTMPELMLRYRAGAFFGRVHCPDVIMGMYSVDELADVPADRVATVERVDFDAYERNVADLRAALGKCQKDEIDKIYGRIQTLMEEHGVTVDDKAADAYETAKNEAKMDE